jgi:hypothetical protein
LAPFRWIDPGGGGECRRLGCDALEADGIGGERSIERDGALLGQRRSGAIVDGGRSHQTDSAVAVFMVVPVEEVPAVSASVLDRAEAIGEVGSVLQGFEPAPRNTDCRPRRAGGCGSWRPRGRSGARRRASTARWCRDRHGASGHPE